MLERKQTGKDTNFDKSMQTHQVALLFRIKTEKSMQTAMLATVQGLRSSYKIQLRIPKRNALYTANYKRRNANI